MARLLGVGASVSALASAPTLTKLATAQHRPNELVAQLARHMQSEPATLLRQLHFYTFGGFASTAGWAHELCKRHAEEGVRWTRAAADESEATEQPSTTAAAAMVGRSRM